MMSTTTLVQCLLASVLFWLPVSDARASPRNARYAAVERRALGWTYAGCYVDAVGARTLTTNPGTTGGTAALTIELCQTTCLGLGFHSSGAEYGGECYCGNAFSNGGALASDGEVGCNMACNGNATEICGGSYRLSVYTYGNLAVVNTSSSSSTSTSKSVSSSSVLSSTSTSTSTSKAVTTSSVSVSSSKTSSSLSSSKTSTLSSSSIKGSSSSSSSKVATSSSLSSSVKSSSSSALSSKSTTSSSLSSSVKSSSSSVLSSKSTLSSSSTKSSSVLSSSSTSKPLSSSTLVTSSTSKSTSASVVSSSTSKSTSVSSSSSKSSSVSTAKPTGSSTLLSSTSSKPSTSSSSSKASSSTLSSSTKLSSSSLVISTTKPVSTSVSVSSAKISSVSQAAKPAGWTLLGCYTDAGGARALTNQIWTIPGATVTNEACNAACLAGGWSLSGTEYADECYCDNVIANGNVVATDGGCTMACNGNATEFCGGSNRISIYSYSDGSVGTTAATSTTSVATSTSAVATTSVSAIAGWIPIGCYTDVNGARTLNTQIYTIVGAMTVELCTAACKTAGFTLAGLEYGGECYCDNAIVHTGALVTDGCTMPCAGNAAELCGGPNRLNVWSLGPQPTGTVSSTTNVAVSTTSTSAVGVSTSLPVGWVYKGCWLDQQHGRILSAEAPNSPTLTVESCVQACVALGYSVAGMEYFTQCYCGNAMINQAVLATSETECNTACGGNAAEICGGGDRMSIYSNQTTLHVNPIPATQTKNLPGSWNYTGCIVDDAVIRTFPYQIDLLTNNTAEACLTQCSEFGYGAGGMEFGEQCFCGDAADVVKAGATALQLESSCNTVCTGNESYYCGGPNRIAYYQWIGEPLTTWDFKTGAAAGAYEFLIGNVMIPLVATAGINGKITFLEKSGTEPAANSTGAYELDLDLLNNFTAAWRPMHVKTDIFCSASLTLPDKVGRQVNIGGWANDATYGVRLYWPDGKPGVWGVNDWQENVNEVSLKAGRWYPTAMTMANGSILVVGGEEGSNGLPVPSLEILPLPAGADVLYCEWLDRTDPYNLYPYLAVLPTGGIVSLYYNEARILNEVSLETQRVLPNMPGAVNNFLGGRTYPFEGTSMLLPQYAPYTDPLTVMVCGGSTPGPEIAIDNCVSIQPEVANANWTIERMPSKRVMSCITALPDGTYIINNGGQQGRAGFGLAIDPNLNAVLYDPTKPLNHRMSVMANTTVARLYHSESILLQDGRILISGSDPEDVRFPQEFRTEVFVPPYLLSGLARPTYTLSTADVAYGGTFTLTVALHQGSTATMRVSLMAAVSSTHGNSMGQRTIFPAFKCDGNVCTVTAPPNAHVSPPAWHMVFVLDGPTPSVAQWIRIGGDPAKLGNWPDFPDFDVPGI